MSGGAGVVAVGAAGGEVEGDDVGGDVVVVGETGMVVVPGPVVSEGVGVVPFECVSSPGRVVELSPLRGGWSALPAEIGSSERPIR